MVSTVKELSRRDACCAQQSCFSGAVSDGFCLPSVKHWRGLMFMRQLLGWVCWWVLIGFFGVIEWRSAQVSPAQRKDTITVLYYSFLDRTMSCFSVEGWWWGDVKSLVETVGAYMRFLPACLPSFSCLLSLRFSSAYEILSRDYPTVEATPFKMHQGISAMNHQTSSSSRKWAVLSGTPFGRLHRNVQLFW